jgi:two-component system, sensor histidine kinase and response regulator
MTDTPLSEIRLVVAEDDPLIRETLQDLLTDFAFQVQSAEDGDAAWDLIEKFEPHVVLTDIRMPKCDGYQLLAKVRAKTPWLPVILLSAKAADSDIRMGMELGAEYYLTKPFEIDKVVESIKTRYHKSQVIKRRLEDGGAFLRRYLPHELRTPLTGVIGYAEMLQVDLADADSLDRETLNSYAEGIITSAERLLDIAENFSLWADLTRQRSGLPTSLVARPSVDPIGQLIVKARQLAARYSRENDICLEVDTESLGLNPNIFNRVSINLLDNACKFSMPGTVIYVRGRQSDDGFYTLTFENVTKAAGIVPSTPEFFGQPHRNTHEQQGLGLGLALADLYSRTLGGSLEVEELKDARSVRIHLKLPVSLAEP